SFREEESSATAVDVGAVVAENLRLRQRIEELREFVDGEPPQPPPPAGARGREGRGGRGGRAGSARRRRRLDLDERRPPATRS
ncbi:unnamed protein product, partial [Ectocarpus sp. 12 AP-2014]